MPNLIMLVYGASVPKKRDQTWTKHGRLQIQPMEHVLIHICSKLLEIIQ